MGVKNLWDILESCKKTLPLHHLQNKRVCVDLSCWMVQLQNVNKSHCPLKDKLYLKGLFHRLRALIALNCSLIFVTDGSIPAIKVSTYRRRLNSASVAAKDDAELHNKSSLRRNMGSDFSCMIKEAKALGMALGIPCLDGIEEAEAQCALLDADSLCDGCFSSDSDIFLFGARTVYRDICLGEGGYVVCYEMEDIKKKLGFGRNSLIALALLLGSDYSQGVRGFGPDSACQIVKSMDEESVLERLSSEENFLQKKSKNSKKQAQVLMHDNKENCVESVDHAAKASDAMHPSQRSVEFLQVINAYLKPKCHPVDSEPVYSALSRFPFQRSKLQGICYQYFDWPPEKTDEYILPKIAERDLRRYANLRSTSSTLGLRFPLNEMPVRCPVAEVIKPRKIQGKECYEVEWDGLDGLRTSIVPAYLVERACPERISEFERRREDKKKQKYRKPRAKKNPPNGKATLTDIDQQLQNLLLEIESDSKLPSLPLNLTTPLDPGSASSSLHLSDVSDLNNDKIRSLELLAVAGRCSKEVIDLSSPIPKPKRHSHNLSGTVVDRKVNIEIIDLSDSDMEIKSPEHARKARELRLFLATIRKDA